MRVLWRKWPPSAKCSGSLACAQVARLSCWNASSELTTFAGVLWQSCAAEDRRPSCMKAFSHWHHMAIHGCSGTLASLSLRLEVQRECHDIG